MLTREQAVLDEVNGTIADARARIALRSRLVVLFAPIITTVFYDVMPPFCLGIGATSSVISAAPAASCQCRRRWRKPAPTR